MELPPQIIDKIRKAIKTILRRGYCDTTEFRSILGKLQHASMGISAGTSLLAPLCNALRSAQRHHKQTVQIHAKSAQSQALMDFRTLFTIMSSRPTHCKELIPGLPAFIGNVDACKWGIGGTWITGNSLLAPIVWHFKWPPKVIAALEAKLITINDLEMAGILLWTLHDLGRDHRPAPHPCRHLV